MKMQKMIRITLTLLAAGLLASKAQALPLDCHEPLPGEEPVPGQAMCTDVTFVIPPPYFATGAENFAGNDDTALIGSLFGDELDNPWTVLDKGAIDGTENGPGALFEGVYFELTSVRTFIDPDGLADEYDWGLTWTTGGSPGLPLYTDFVFVTKGSNQGAAYYFDEVYFPNEGGDSGDGGGTFLITYTTGKKENIPDLSHATVYARTTGEFDIDPPIPVPGTLFLVGIGLFGLARSVRRNS
jgi:hypothetical protein